MIRLSLFLIILTLSLPVHAQDRVLDIQEVKSSNGLTAWLVEDHTLPLISFKFFFKGAGALNNSAEQQGLSRLLSNTLDEGAGDLDSQSFQKNLSDNSVSLSFLSGRDNFGGTVKTLSRNKETAFDLLKKALNEPRFDAEPIERMKQANLSRIKNSQANPNWIAARLMNDVSYENHPYALNSGGTLSSLPAITADDLKEYKNQQLTQNRLVVGVFGDITKEELATLLDDIFGDLPKEAPKDTAEKIDIQNGGKTYLYQKDIPQSIIMMTMPSIDQNDPDYYALQIMNHIFGGSGFGSRLTEEAREKRGLTYGIFSGINNYDYAKALSISTSTQNSTVTEMMNVIDTEIKALPEDDLQEEIVKAKAYLIGSLPLSLTSSDNVSSILAAMQLNDRPIDYLDQYAANLNKVNEDDVKNIARKLLDPTKTVTVIVGKPEGIENTIEIKEIPNVE